MNRKLKLALSVVAALALAPVATQAADGTLVRISVSNIAKPGGVLLAGAYDQESTWLGGTTVASIEVPVPATVTGTLGFEMRLPPGRYALSVFQDMNGNRKLDTNFIGIPTEQSGSSNNAPARFGPPKFRDAAFVVGSEAIDLAIRLN